MLSTTMHHALANASSKFGPAIFSHLGFQARAAAALDATDRWEKRRRALGALLRITVLVFMPLYRSLSIQNVLKKVLTLLREIEPELSLIAVTPEAVTINGEFKINRSDFGMTYGQGKVDNPVTIKVSVNASRKK